MSQAGKANKPGAQARAGSELVAGRVAAASRRFAALRTLGMQSHLSEVQRALKDSIDALAIHEAEVPFALAFVLDSQDRAHLVSAYGVEHAGEGLAVRIATAEWLCPPQSPAILDVSDLPGLIAFSEVSGGAPRAHVARIASASQPAPFGLLVLGLDPEQQSETDYLTFIELVAERIGRSARLASEREARTRAVGLLDALPALISVTRGPGHVYEFVNRAYAEATGLERSTIGKTFRQAHPEEQLRSLSPHRDRAFAGEPVELIETPLVSGGPDADPSYFNILYQPLLGLTGEVEGVLSFALDVTEQVTARKRVEALAEELGQATRFKDELLALVSHELRTPLTIALGSLDLLHRRLDSLPPAEAASLVDDALQNARRLERLVANMLALSRAELVGVDDLTPVLLQRMLPRTVAEIARDLRFDPARIQLHLSEVAPVMGNPVYIEQIVANLISNAFKYGEPGRPVDLDIAETSDGMVTLSVESGGEPMDTSDVEALFAPFVRAAGTGESTSGLGLGLAVCRRLAHAQGGDIAAEPAAGGGLRVTLRLPAALE